MANGVREIISEIEGSASMVDGVAEAERELDLREQELDAAVRAFSGLDDVEAARERLLQLRGERDRARERLDDLQAAVVPTVRVRADDWDVLILDERRALIRAVIDRVTVAPGRGADRITVYPRGE